MTLRIFTNKENVTIEFDLWHDHVDGTDEAAVFEEALREIDDLLNERLAVQVFMADDAWKGALLVEPTTPLENPWPELWSGAPPGPIAGPGGEVTTRSSSVVSTDVPLVSALVGSVTPAHAQGFDGGGLMGR